MNRLTRRKFLEACLKAGLVGATVQLVSCLNAENGDPEIENPPEDDDSILGSVGDNHGHKASISQVQLEEGLEVTLQIQGTSEHPHTLVLSETALALILQGRRVSMRSSADWGHAHEVVFNAA